MSGPAPGRSCAGCTLCCKLMGISALEKPPGRWCSHCDVGEGCQIYDARPAECRTFNCAWLTDVALSEAWAPKTSRIIVAHDKNRIAVHVDPARAGAWRKAPFYQTILQWGAALAPRGGQVLVFDAGVVFAILPDGEKPLGAVTPDQVIISTRRERPQGPAFDVIVMPKDDPRAQRVMSA